MSTTNTDTLQNNFGKINPRSISTKKTLGTRVFFGLMFFAIIYGWLKHDDFYLSAESGFGYYLGIAGGISMLVLLLYPIRKKVSALRNFGPIRYWFKAHMALGIIGPTLILYHANYSLGSINSNVALLCMIVVSLSGLVGRFIYTRIHYGLYGEKMTLADLKADLEKSRLDINKQFLSFPDIQEQLNQLEAMVARRRNFLAQIIVIPVIAIRIYFRRKKIKRTLKQDLKNNKTRLNDINMDLLKASLQTIYNYIETIRRLGQLMTYERLFSLWHILHLPLFIMLVITGIIHVFAVHMY